MIRLRSFVKPFLLSMLLAYLLSLIISPLPLRKVGSSLDLSSSKKMIGETWSKFFSDKAKPDRTMKIPVIKERKTTGKPTVTTYKLKRTRKRTLMATLRPTIKTVFGTKVRPTTKREATKTKKITEATKTTKSRTKTTTAKPTKQSKTTKAATTNRTTTTFKTQKISLFTTPKVAKSTNKRKTIIGTNLSITIEKAAATATAKTTKNLRTTTAKAIAAKTSKTTKTALQLTKTTTTLNTRKPLTSTTTKVARITNKRITLKRISKSINTTARHKLIKNQAFSTTFNPTTNKASKNKTMVNEATKIQCKDVLSMKLNVSKVTDLNRKEIDTYVTSRCGVKDVPKCKQDQLVGPLPINSTIVDLKELYKTELSFVQFGGWWAPKNCREIAKTAILVPFRDRYQHLPVFLRQLHPLLQRQNLHYRIFVIEQNDTSGFNRAKLFNVGYREALKLFPYDCFVFHDIDLIPENDKINYGCEKSPMHLSVAVDKFNYQLPYDSIFGGVGMIRPAHFEKVNGFSNIFYSWGGEDDVLSSRLRGSGFKLNRQSVQIARYKMLRHKSKGRSRDDVALTSRVMSTSLNHQHDDGLNSLQYRVKRIVQKQLYTMIKVDLQKEKEKTFGIKI